MLAHTSLRATCVALCLAVLAPNAARAFEDFPVHAWDTPEWRKAHGIRALTKEWSEGGKVTFRSHHEFDREGRLIYEEQGSDWERYERDADGQLIHAEVRSLVNLGLFNYEYRVSADGRTREQIRRDGFGFITEVVRERLASDGTPASRKYITVTGDVKDTASLNEENSQLEYDEAFAVDGMIRGIYSFGRPIRGESIKDGLPVSATVYGAVRDDLTIEDSTEWRYEYDDKGGHVAIHSEGPEGKSTTRWEYQYDAEGRPLRVISGGESTRFAWIRFDDTSPSPEWAGKRQLPDAQIDMERYFDLEALRAAQTASSPHQKDGSHFFDENGKQLTRQPFALAGDFVDGVAGVRIKDHWGLVSKNGTVISQPIFDDVRPLSEGRIVFRQGARWGFVDETGRVVLPPTHALIGREFVNGAVSFAKRARFRLLSATGAEWGLLDRAGNVVVAPVWDEVQSWGDGATWGLRDDRWHLVNAAGETGYVAPAGADVGSFSSGLAAVRKGTETFYVDAAGTKILGPYVWGSSFQEERAIISDSGKCRYIDPRGNVIFEAGDAVAPTGNSDAPWGRDIFGEVYGACRYLTGFSEGIASGRLEDGKWVLLTRDGGQLGTETYPQALRFRNGVATYKVGDEKKTLAHPNPALIPTKRSPPERIVPAATTTSSTSTGSSTSSSSTTTEPDPTPEPEVEPEPYVADDSDFSLDALFDYDGLDLKVGAVVYGGVDTNPYQTNPAASGVVGAAEDDVYLSPHGTVEASAHAGVAYYGDGYDLSAVGRGAWRGFLGDGSASEASGADTVQLFELMAQLELAASLDLDEIKVNAHNHAGMYVTPTRHYNLDTPLRVPFSIAPYGRMAQRIYDVGRVEGVFRFDEVGGSAGYLLFADKHFDAGVAGSMMPGALFSPSVITAPGDWIATRRADSPLNLDNQSHIAEATLHYNLDGIVVGMGGRAGAMLSSNLLAIPWEARAGAAMLFGERLSAEAWIGYGSLAGDTPASFDIINNLVGEVALRANDRDSDGGLSASFVLRRRFHPLPTHSGVIINEALLDAEQRLGGLSIGAQLGAGMLQMGREHHLGETLSVATADNTRTDFSGFGAFRVDYALGPVTLKSQLRLDAFLSDALVFDTEGIVPQGTPLDFGQAQAVVGVAF
jgi:hypothetical protein